MLEHIADLPEKLRVGQTKAILALADFFHDHDRGILWMCCGSGKTVACAVDIELRGEPLTVVFTPYIHLVKQWQRDYQKWLPTTQAKFMCVCSEKDPAYELDPIEKADLLKSAENASAEEFSQLVDEAKKSHGQLQVSTDAEEIASFLKQKGRKVVFCTYASSPVYGEAQRLAGIHANYGVFDEAQWTATGENDTQATYPLHDVNVQIDKRLFTTATVRHYTRKGMIYSMDNESVYGRHVLIDGNGNPDPWTTRQAIEHKEVSPYRIVISFITDPTFDPRIVQLPRFQDLKSNRGEEEWAEVLRRIGQATAMERLKEKYGVKKPLGFFDTVSTARLYTDILNVCKKYPEHFPELSRSEPAVSISTYESRAERKRRVAHLHNSPETEVNNSRLFLFGTDESTIDSVFFGDPMTSNINVIQASGRALRYVPGKIATIMLPAMLPYYGNDLQGYAKTITSKHVHDAYRYIIDILDGLADMDPLLRDQVLSGSGTKNDGSKIIEFDFPEEILPEIRKAITTEVWREVDPESDFVEALLQSAAALERYRFQKFPPQDNNEKERRMSTRVI
ncbi:MAG: DEAD/DEAH box helicase family protein [Alphaproteobacteria bacterium]|nr:DEAD/DEAH box helicase family protein [Alphaproteobacteria bacterium]